MIFFEPEQQPRPKSLRWLADKLGLRNNGAPGTLAVAILTLLLAGFIAFTKLENVLRISLLAVVVVVWIALWLVIFISKDPSAKEIGVALLSGLLVAGAAFALNTVLTSALLDQNMSKRQAETRLTINQGQQFSFRRQDLRGFDLSGMALNGTETKVYDLSFADLSGANLKKAELRGAQLRQAMFRRADLGGADLAQASLRSADLTDANLSGANLSGADLSGATGFVEPLDEPALLSSETRCPGDVEAGGSGSDGPFAAPDSDGRYTCVKDNQVMPSTNGQAHVAFFVSKDDALGSVVGQVTTNNPNATAVEYEIVNDNSCSEYPAGFASSFAIDRTSGVITIAKLLVEDVAQAQFCVGFKGETEEPITVHIVPDQEPVEAEPALTFLMPADAEDGSRVGQVRAPETWIAPKFSIEGDSSEVFQIDAGKGVLTLNGVLQPDSPPRLLTVRIESGVRSTSLVVRVAVNTDEAAPLDEGLARDEPTQFLVENGGRLDVGVERGLLTQEHLDAGLSVEVTNSPTSGSFEDFEPNGAFTYVHDAGEGADVFSYRALGQPNSDATAAIAVVSKTEFDDLRSTSELGVAVASLAVLGQPSDAIDYSLKSSDDRTWFEVDPEGNLLTSVPGQELFEEGPWHEVDVTVTDLRHPEHPVDVSISVSVAPVVDANTSLSRVATQVCPEAESGAYVEEIVRVNELVTATAIDPGDVLTLPPC